MNLKSFVVLHHSLTKDSGTVSWGAIRKYHMDPAGPYKMRDIGYHFGVEMVDDRPEILIGRLPSEEGAHCKEMGMNTKAFGVCVVGNFDLAPPDPVTLEATRKLVRYLMWQWSIPVTNVLGHRDVGAALGFDWKKGEYKSCPGGLFDLTAFRASLGP